jgi:nucleotide-binding universal stress UspA family protein
MRILLCTDGSRYANNSLRFGALISGAHRSEVVVLSVAESSRDASRAERALAQARALLAEAGLPSVETRLRHGHAAEQILAEIDERGYDLVVVGGRGRRAVNRFVPGSTADRLARLSRIPVLIVHGERSALRRVLVCTGGNIHGEVGAQIGGQIAGPAGASVTVLHVMSQVPLTPIADALELERSAEEAMALDTGEGRHLRRTLAILQAMGVTGQARLRHGLVVDEILAEAREGDYDLIVVGAHVASGRFTFLLDDVCNQIIKHADRPVLVARRAVHGVQSANQERG